MAGTAIPFPSIELKLRLAPAEMAALKDGGVQSPWRAAAPATIRISSVYWDTPDLALAAAGIVLRIRAIGHSRLQTVQTANSREGAVHSRREWAWPIADDTPDTGVLRATGLPIFAKRATGAALRPVFSTSVLRTLHHLKGGDWDIDLSLDQGDAGIGDRHKPLCEAELELTRGAPRHVFALAAKLVEAAPNARVLTLSKADRVHLLAADTPPLPVKAKPTRIVATMTVTGAFQAIARNCLDHLVANERCLLTTRDAEAIHQMRVALRRLRSAIKVFRRLVTGPDLDRLKGEMGWILGVLGPARDDHVFLSEIIEPVVSAHPETAPLTALKAEWMTERERNAAAALAAIAEPRFTRLLLALAAWVEDGVWLSDTDRPGRDDAIGPFAARVLSRRDLRLRKMGGRDLSILAPAELHSVRIFGKQLRYAAEFFAPLYPAKTTRPFLDLLGELQDGLGQLNDIAVAGTRLTMGQSGDGLAWAAGLVAGWHAGRRPGLLAEAGRLWKRYRKIHRFWDDRR